MSKRTKDLPSPNRPAPDAAAPESDDGWAPLPLRPNGDSNAWSATATPLAHESAPSTHESAAVNHGSAAMNHGSAAATHESATAIDDGAAAVRRSRPTRSIVSRDKTPSSFMPAGPDRDTMPDENWSSAHTDTGLEPLEVEELTDDVLRELSTDSEIDPSPTRESDTLAALGIRVETKKSGKELTIELEAEPMEADELVSFAVESSVKPSPLDGDDLRRTLAGIMEGAQAAFDRADVTKATEIAERALTLGGGPSAAAFQPYAPLLLRIYESAVGSGQGVLRPRTGQAAQVMALDSRSAHLLSRIDGALTVDQLLEVSGMPRLEALRLVALLIKRGVVSTIRPA